jgi:hypothetical protein
MACVLTLHGLPDGQDAVLAARFGWENNAQGLCARRLEEINDILRPNGIFVARVDLRYQKREMKKLIADWHSGDEMGASILKKFFTLPLPALQGLVISCFQYFAVTSEENVDEKFGPFARFKDGGEIETEGEGLGEFPKLVCIDEAKPENIPQSFLPFYTDAAEDGTSTNEVVTILHGLGVVYSQLGHCKGLREVFSGVWNKDQIPKERPQLPGVVSKLELYCDEDNGWRIINRGDIPMGFTLTPKLKYLRQVFGPQKWKMTILDEQNPFLH